MTQKDYGALAAAIRAERLNVSTMNDNDRQECEKSCDNIAQNVAGVLAQDNPRFKRDMFLKACGVES